jgi:hypothetical protein
MSVFCQINESLVDLAAFTVDINCAGTLRAVYRMKNLPHSVQAIVISTLSMLPAFAQAATIVSSHAAPAHRRRRASAFCCRMRRLLANKAATPR